MKTVKVVILFFIVILVLISCATNISSIKEDPRKYINKPVTIKGMVIDVNRIPLTSLKIVEIYDRTDTIYVLTNREVKKNRKSAFKGEIIPINRQIPKEKARILQMKVAEFLIDNDLASPREAKQYARKILEFLVKVVPKNELTIFMLAHKT